ncbi:MAG TPA: GAF domain-containing protein [bacterium]|nr:GAF domain-containing protein [bacterium]HOG44870.1 GAF domain-containing protein [bacterium]HPG34838.1 GAF domain-containing protein [bacterium]HPM46304.1 GAF domain-containing protein [bacterium]HRQ68713.1 GAF domain-containing protein [bacterium]
MTKFEVLVPLAEGGKEVVVREEGPNWFCALESALSGLGMADSMKNVICDVKEDGAIHVTDTASGRKFLVRELDLTKNIQKIKEEPKKEEPKVTRKDEMLADLFTDVMDAWDLPEKDIPGFFLDLALKYIPSESGSFAKSDLSSTDMEFVACRGPKGDDVCGIKIKVGQGLVGFSAKHSCFIAVGDVHKDPRFFKEISEKIGYETTSIACAPVKSLETTITFGVLELINKKNSYRYNEDDLEFLRFIAEKMAELFHSRWTESNNNLED